MAQYSDQEKDTEQNPEETPTAELTNVGENIDLVGGRVITAPDFVELASQGFSEGQLKDILKLRRRYNETEENEVTPEFKRLRFARFLYSSGKIEG
ncbi:MAG: hypothetical protein JWP00_3764 [Chloroflexi bacterium]|jgi:hypothetical protein|nr:hypothetical protein [Chloroflexota bacterium]